MQQVISITKQWQVYIPEEVREKINLKNPGKAKIGVKKGEIVIKPLKSKILSLAGSLSGKKPKKPIKIDKVREYIDYSLW